jgi:oligopeptide transport system ATP-binding protein
MGLMKSVPNPNSTTKERLVPIPGSPPDLLSPPKGCPFCARCPFTMRKCLEELPPLYEVTKTQKSRCHLLNPNAPKVEAFEKGVIE